MSYINIIHFSSRVPKQISNRVSIEKNSSSKTDLNVYENSVKCTKLIPFQQPAGQSAKCADNSFGSDIQSKRHNVLSRDEPTQ